MAKNLRLSLDRLRGFRAAARHLSFTRAAEEMFVTQSAISHEVKSLEEQIGQPLFHRDHRALKLTRAGEALYDAADEALTRLDAVVERLAGDEGALTVVTTTALASLWLAPRLPGFSRIHPEVNVRVVTSNDKPDLERDQIDVGIRFVSAGADIPDAAVLATCESFPVCSPALANDPARPLRTPADLARHVRLDYETVRDGRRWSEWDFWFDAMKIPTVPPASTLQFPQYDQWVPAAIEGAGVAIGVLPHLTPQLRSGVLCAPFGRASFARRGTFFLVLRGDAAGRESVGQLAAWLRSEVEKDRDLKIPTSGAAQKQARRPSA